MFLYFSVNKLYIYKKFMPVHSLNRVFNTLLSYFVLSFVIYAVLGTQVKPIQKCEKADFTKLHIDFH